MVSLLKRMIGLLGPSSEPPLIGGPNELAPDGTRDVLRSGTWSVNPLIPVESFPESLLLTEKDVYLTPEGTPEVVLAAAHVGGHLVELLLCDSDTDAVVFAIRIPTAANQFKEPYIVMEAEHGNSREDAVREIDFHLQGRIHEREVRATAWKEIFRTAADKLEGLRGRD
jgi:hypothetical protein